MKQQKQLKTSGSSEEWEFGGEKDGTGDPCFLAQPCKELCGF